eukprot:6045578-Pyramimonas_sp.AAC.1
MANAMTIAAMLFTMLATTTARPTWAPMLIAPATMAAPSRRRRRFWREFDMRARPTRDSGPHGIR